MKMTNDDNETIKKFYFFLQKKFYKHRLVLCIEVIRPILNFLFIFFFYEKISHAQKTQKKHKKTQKSQKNT